MIEWLGKSSKEILDDMREAYEKIDWKEVQKVRSGNILIQQIIENKLEAYPVNLPGDDGKPTINLIYNGTNWRLYMPTSSTRDDLDSALKQLREIANKEMEQNETNTKRHS